MGRYSEALQKIEEERKKKGLGPFPESSGENRFALRNYAIGILAALLVVLVIGYLHGVQKGMHLASAPSSVKNSSEVQKPLNEVAASEGNTALLENLEQMMKMSYETKPVPVASNHVSLASQQTKTNFYTIQLATYQDIARAREEASKLNQKGYRAVILRSNKYFAVCIDKLDDKTQAASRLIEIQNTLGVTYPGALVRFVKTKSSRPQIPAAASQP